MAENATIFTECPHCQNSVEIFNSWTAGGVNDYGGFVLECNKCKKPFDAHVGKDINMSNVVSGATRLDKYDDEVEGQKKRILAKYGL